MRVRKAVLSGTSMKILLFTALAIFMPTMVIRFLNTVENQLETIASIGESPSYAVTLTVSDDGSRHTQLTDEVLEALKEVIFATRRR